jgi:hypothetical protein
MVAGALSVLTVILPQLVAHEVYGRSLAPAAIVWSQLYAGARLGLSLVALAAAFTPRPPRALVRAILVGLTASVVGPLFSAITSGVPWSEIKALRGSFFFDGGLALVLLATSMVRANLAAEPEPEPQPSPMMRSR